MRHRKSGRKLNRNASHRKADFMNMSNSLIAHGLIQTTLAKAKELRRIFEPLVTLAKKGDTVANRRLVFNRLRDRQSVSMLFSELVPLYQSRPGGFIRIIKNGFRPGDNAPKAVVALVDRAKILSYTSNSDSNEVSENKAEVVPDLSDVEAS